MLARRLRIAQLLELSLYAAIAAVLARSRGWGVVEAVAFVAACILGVRFLLLAASFALGELFRTPRAAAERIGALGMAALLAREYAALLRFNLAYFPWESLLLRPDPAPEPGRAPVILVHGYLANRGNFCGTVRRLEREGYGPFFVPNLRSFNAPIEDFAAELEAVVERLHAASGCRVVLVGHSMGGLGIRAYLARRGPARVARIVTVGSPHHGTALAPMGQGENARQMRVGSAFLAALERSEGPQGPGVPTLCIRSTHDNLVAPQASARLAWARNVTVRGLGHLEMIESAAVLELLRRELR